MLSLAFIRKNPDVVRRAAELKAEPAPVDEILRLDTTWREHLTAAEKIKEEQNKLSRSSPGRATRYSRNVCARWPIPASASLLSRSR